MKIMLMIAASLSFAFGLYALTLMVSDIQLTLAAIGIIGGFILTGLVAVLERLDRA